MSAHTPGPWRSYDVTDDADEACGLWVVDIPETDGNTITRLYFGDMENNSGEDIANANLVAAAPDLLAACQAALACGLRGQWTDEAGALLRQALAKARGE